MSETADSVTATSEVEVSKSPVKAASNGQEDSTPATETATKNGHMSAEERDKKILRQVEYYFGNYNLPKDKFLTDEMKKDDGWVPMSVMLKFKRLAALSDVEEVIAAALKNSSLLQLSEDGTKIRRSPECPLPPVGDDWKERLMERTLYIKGLPIEFDLDATLSFFNEFEDFENVQRRNWLDKKSSEWRFKGSVYVTFKSREKAQQVLDNLPVKYKDEDLEVKWQAEHIEEKQAERGSKRNQKADKGESKEVEEVEGAEVSAETEKTEAPKYLLGTVLHMKGFKEDVNWPDIKDALNVFQVGRVAYVDFSNGDVEGYARFFEEDAARRVFEKLETPGRLKVGENMVDVRVVEGEEETKYMDAQMEARSKRPPGKKRKYHTGRDRGGHMPKRGRV